MKNITLTASLLMTLAFAASLWQLHQINRTALGDLTAVNERLQCQAVQTISIVNHNKLVIARLENRLNSLTNQFAGSK